MATTDYGSVSWERMIGAVEKVRQRLLRATAALEQAGVPYAVIGGNAVAAWVSTIDEAAVRNTADVDLLLNRADLPAAIVALESAGFFHRHAADVTMFLDGPEGKFRDAVHVIFANEKVRQEYSATAPSIDERIRDKSFDLVSLDALVRMKLTSFRDKDRTHLRDMLEVGLIDSSWISHLSPELGGRLQELIDTPDG
ncbi:hypothetical protein Pan44_29550 [Caulifigura coniformis]|uniref:Uncharacterized protein n=1 Tax=Caulifigura coniformis TaxID=2527983 RepID=A0A517SFL3_9PLAN|nr:nucleotidyltransferase family protein [Caulifigura coniformis]QDT54915.1 hypothetical protein Pan44_29550 [Caulifigura coniformis]